MSITLKTRKMLWGRAANRCAYCRKELVIDSTETDDESVVGEECHIVGEKEDGPRGVSPLTHEQRDKYGNLVLLCCVHHKMVDDQPGEYSVDRLTQLKNEHESWVRTSLAEFDADKQRDDEQYADIVQELCDRTDIDNWQNWTSFLLGGGYPRIWKEIHSKLNTIPHWLLARVWPGRYPTIEMSFHNFRIVLSDFLNVFGEHSEPFGNDMFATERFYKIDEWNPERYDRLSRQHEFHVDLVQDLVLELTRAANYVCACVREELFRSFRLKEGVLLVTYGPVMDMSYRTVRPEYRREEKAQQPFPYPGLEKFMAARAERDYKFGHGDNL